MNKFYYNLDIIIFLIIPVLFLITIGVCHAFDAVMKYNNYQNSLDKVMDCRKTVGTNVSARVEHVCGKIPQWENFR